MLVFLVYKFEQLITEIATSRDVWLMNEKTNNGILHLPAYLKLIKGVYLNLLSECRC